MKNLSLIIAISLLIVQLLTSPDQWTMTAITNQSSLFDSTRLSYMIVHVNWFHLAINLYTFLALVFLCNARLIHFLFATMIAALIPNVLLSDTPMLGMSVLNYALTGILITKSRKWAWLFVVNLIIVGAGAFFSNVAFYAHMWGYIVAFISTHIYNLMTKPMFDE